MVGFHTINTEIEPHSDLMSYKVKRFCVRQLNNLPNVVGGSGVAEIVE